MARKSSFRVIIVGGSLSGLTMAHMLHRLNIDYVVLERGSEIAFAGGASIGLQPHALRIMDQLGMYEDILGTTVPMTVTRHRRPDGKAFSESRFSRHLENRHAYPILFFEREELLKILYKHLPEKARVLCSKKVVDIESSVEGAVVTTADGCTYSGDLVIGADGVNSFTRQAMWKHMAATEPDLVKKEANAMFSDYSCAFGVSIYDSDDPELTPGYGHITYGCQKSSIVIVSSERKKFWFLILKNDKRYFAPNIPRYSHEDAESSILKNADWCVTEKTRIADLWEKRTKFTMVSLEEVMFERWHEGRLVLLGDAVHKVTPNAGHGGNTAIESAVALANLLHEAHIASEKANTDYSSITSVLEAYQKCRSERVALACKMSSMATRLQATDNLLYKLLGFNLLPLFGEELEANAASELILGGEPLHFVGFKGKTGSIPWGGWGENSNNDGQPGPISFLIARCSYATVGLGAIWLIRNGTAKAISSASMPPPRNSTDALSPDADFVIPRTGCASISETADSMATLMVCLNLLPIGVVVAVESLRRANLKNLPLVPLLLAVSLFLGGLSSLGFLFLFAYAVQFTLAPVSDPHEYLLPIAQANSLLWGTLGTLLLAVFLSTNTTQLIWPLSETIRNKMTLIILQSFPVLPLFLTQILSWSKGSKSKFSLGHQDIGTLKTTYGLTVLVSALSHISGTFSRLIQALKLPEWRVSGWRSIAFQALGGDHANSSLMTSYMSFTAAALVFVYACCVNALPQRSRSAFSMIKIAAGMVLSAIVLGPGTTVGLLWIWREDKIRCDRLPPTVI